MKIERSRTGDPVMFEMGSNGNGIGKAQVIMDYKGNPLAPISIPRRGTPESQMYNGVFRVYPRMKVMTLERLGLKGHFQLWEIVSVIGEGEFRLITEYNGDFSKVWKDGNYPHTLDWAPRPLWESLNKACEALIKRSYISGSLMYWRKREPRNQTQITVDGQDACLELAKFMNPDKPEKDLKREIFKCREFMNRQLAGEKKSSFLEKGFTEEEYNRYLAAFNEKFDVVELTVTEA